MNSEIAVVLILALICANLPFLTERLFFVIAFESGRKHVAWRLLELGVLYVVLGGVCLALESRQGQVHQQRWEFYAITLCLFLVFAYPGFVYRYFWRVRN